MIKSFCLLPCTSYLLPSTFSIFNLLCERGNTEMSAIITIKPKGLFGKKLCLKDLLTEELTYGIDDPYGRFEEGKEGSYTIIFDPDDIGRGVQIHFDGTETELHLNYFNSRHDIELCYMLVSRVCKLQGVDTFVREGETFRLGQIEQAIQRDIDANSYALQVAANNIASGETKKLTVFAAVNPLDIGEKEIALFGTDIDKFSRWLHERQSADRYYAVPHFYEKPDGTTFGSFAIRAGVLSIIPLVPEIPMSMKGQFEVSDWYVLLGYNDESRESDGKMKVVPYDKLVENVPDGEYYDANHMIVELTDDDVDELLGQFITQI